MVQQMFRKSIIAVFALFFIFAAGAGEIHCRSGVIKAAQLTRLNVSIAKLDPLAFPNLPANKIFAVVSIKLDDLRPLSIFDYTLEAFGVSSPCVALRRNGRFEYFTESVSGPAIQQMLFVVDGSLVSGGQKVENLTLRSALSDGKNVYRTVIPFSVIGSRPPTAPGSIPADGMLEMEE